ncbi:hypothetical protein NQ318_015852 [Aromia moschata]|uniref:DUF659 domain-containing protein n=1 Tax=Aromia moschata TaxID=1265417 RepID=A0AAV8YPB8_9CUCU|nr:hypothetical protein NQ318_015852 [Aromia moschata]
MYMIDDIKPRVGALKYLVESQIVFCSSTWQGDAQLVVSCKVSIPVNHNREGITTDSLPMLVFILTTLLSHVTQTPVMDEAIDRSGRSVVNFLIGALKPNSASGSHLVASKLLDITNEKTVIEFVTECFHCLWPNQNNSKKVLLMLTGEAAYMRKAGDMLTKTLPNMIHFTCAAHGLNQIAETIRNSFPLVNDLIENVHKIFVKAPTRIDMFREALPHVPLPPEPVVTRWDTWLEAVAYYDKHFAELKCVIFRFDPNESNAMHTVLNLLQLQSIRDEVRYINSNYSILITAIKKLGTYGLSLQEQFMVLDAVKQKINSYNSHDASTLDVKRECEFLKPINAQ